ncbi:unnamed protein product, partial [Soboliphyme baturini]|uniref:Ubiquitin carboxyl-terminal hydrolase 2 n=1 Tax=Soboliphyme baturini TaxID=241478 RepID=A0A183ITM8_9BILA
MSGDVCRDSRIISLNYSNSSPIRSSSFPYTYSRTYKDPSVSTNHLYSSAGSKQRLGISGEYRSIPSNRLGYQNRRSFTDVDFLQHKWNLINNLNNHLYGRKSSVDTNRSLKTTCDITPYRPPSRASLSFVPKSPVNSSSYDVRRLKSLVGRDRTSSTSCSPTAQRCQISSRPLSQQLYSISCSSKHNDRRQFSPFSYSLCTPLSRSSSSLKAAALSSERAAHRVYDSCDLSTRNKSKTVMNCDYDSTEGAPRHYMIDATDKNNGSCCGSGSGLVSVSVSVSGSGPGSGTGGTSGTSSGFGRDFLRRRNENVEWCSRYASLGSKWATRA